MKSSKKTTRKSIYVNTVPETNTDEEYPMDDLIDLPDTQLETISNTLSRRFNTNDFFTNIDITFLLSINTFNDDLIYTNKYLESYANADVDASFRYPPHVYELAENAYRDMLKTMTNQSIMIFGEHGSGKTTMAAHILRYLTLRTSYSDPAPAGYRESHLMSKADKLLAIPTIINAFGCAKTGVYVNSSRVGILNCLYFDGNGVIQGSEIHPFCLDTSRIISQKPGDSNFNVFSYLFAAKSAEHTDRFLIEKGAVYNFFPVEDSNVNVDLDEFRRALMILGFSLETQDQIFSVLAAILHLGNVQFTPSGEATRLDLKSIRALRSAAKLLEMEEHILKKSLTFDENSGRPLNAHQADDGRNALAKFLYRRVFMTVINRINKEMGSNDHNELLQLAILDPPGYENTKIGTFQQFKVNFVDEVMQAMKNQFLFVDEQMEYEEDGLAWEPISFNDNSICVRQLVGSEITELSRATSAPFNADSVVGLLNPRGDELNLATFFKGLKRISNIHNSCIDGVDERSSSFRLHHFFGKISYDATSFVIENSEPLRFNFTNLFKKSKSDFLLESLSLANLLQDMDFGDPSRPLPSMTRFYQTFQLILRQISTRSPWFLQCLKSNTRAKANSIDELHMMEQLKILNICEHIKMRQRCYPIRMSFVEFFDRYNILLKKKRKFRKNKTLTDLQPSCVDIIQVSLAEIEEEQIGQPYQIGIHHVYITTYTHKILEFLIDVKKEYCATEIQRIWKGYKARLSYKDEMVAQRHAKRTAVQKIERAYIMYKTKVKAPKKRVASKRLKSLLPAITPVPTSRRASATAEQGKSINTFHQKMQSGSAWDMIDLESTDAQLLLLEIETDVVDFLSWACSVLRVRNQLDTRHIVDSFFHIIKDGTFLLKLASIIYTNLPSPEELLQETEDAEGRHSLFLDVCEKFTGIEEQDLYDIPDVIGDTVNIQKVIRTLGIFKTTVSATSESFTTLKRFEKQEVIKTPSRITDFRTPSERNIMRKPSVGQISQSSTLTDRAYPNILSNLQDLVIPNRKFICKGSVWEVINTNMVKERCLFLFSDIIVIAKEMKQLDEERSLPEYPVYNTKFMVKTVIHLGSMVMRLDRDEDPFDILIGSPIMNKALMKFERNPKAGISYLMDKGLFSSQPSSIAQFIYRTTSLNKRQLGRFLGSPDNQPILQEYLYNFDMVHMRIDEALRIFLSTFRLPGDPKTIDSILEAFSTRFYSTNHGELPNAELTLKLVFAILMLNADIHRREDSLNMMSPRMSLDEFVDKFKVHDSSNSVSRQTLAEIYEATCIDKIGVASENEDAESGKLSLVFSKMPFRVTVKEYSIPVTVQIPIPDSNLVIRLFPSQGLKCYPSILTFNNSNNATFRVYGESIGKKSIAFLKSGSRSCLYSSAGIPFGKPIIVEPPFMRHVFQIKAKEKDQQTKRKVSYMFSVANDTQKATWAQNIDYAMKTLENGIDVEHGLSLEYGSGSQIIEDFLLAPNGAVIIPTNFKV